MNLPTLAVRRPITTAMLLLSILLFGAIAWSRLQVAFLPEVDIPFIAVEVPYVNTNPAQVEREITKPVEESLATLSGIKKLRSNSNADGGFVFMQFDWGQDLERLSHYLEQRGNPTVRVHYGPHIAPEHYGIRALNVTRADWAERPASQARIQSGRYTRY